MMEKFLWKEQSDHTLRNKDITPANHLVANNNLFSNENETFFLLCRSEIENSNVRKNRSMMKVNLSSNSCIQMH